MKKTACLLICLILVGCITPQGRYEIDINQAIAITQLAITTAESSLQLYIMYQESKPAEIERRQDHIDRLREHLRILLLRDTAVEDLLPEFLER